MIKLSSMPAGKISKEKTFLSGSDPGSMAPFTKARLYRSFKPRTMAYLPSWMVVPLERLSTSAVFLSGDFLI